MLHGAARGGAAQSQRVGKTRGQMMIVAWTQLVVATAFLGIAIALRIWAARKYAKVREGIESSEFQEAFNALRASSDTAFMFLIMTLVWMANQAWSRL